MVKAKLRDLEDRDIFLNFDSVMSDTREKAEEILKKSKFAVDIVGRQHKILSSARGEVRDALVMYRVAFNKRGADTVLSLPIRYKDGAAYPTGVFFIVKEGRKVSPKEIPIGRLDAVIADHIPSSSHFNPFTGFFTGLARKAVRTIFSQDEEKGDLFEERKELPELEEKKPPVTVRAPKADFFKHPTGIGKYEFEKDKDTNYYRPIDDPRLKEIVKNLAELGKSLQAVQNGMVEATKSLKESIAKIEAPFKEKEEMIREQANELAAEAFNQFGDVVNLVLGTKDLLFVLSQESKVGSVSEAEIREALLEKFDKDGEMSKFIEEYREAAKRVVREIERRAIVITPKPKKWESRTAAQDTLLLLLSALKKMGDILGEKLEKTYAFVSNALDKKDTVSPDVDLSLATRPEVAQKVHDLYTAGKVDPEAYRQFMR